MQLVGEDVSGCFHFLATENLAPNIPLTSAGPRANAPKLEYGVIRWISLL